MEARVLARVRQGKSPFFTAVASWWRMASTLGCMNLWGPKRPVTHRLMVVRETPTISANSCWVSSACLITSKFNVMVHVPVNGCPVAGAPEVGV